MTRSAFFRLAIPIALDFTLALPLIQFSEQITRTRSQAQRFRRRSALPIRPNKGSRSEAIAGLDAFLFEELPASR